MVLQMDSTRAHGSGGDPQYAMCNLLKLLKKCAQDVSATRRGSGLLGWACARLSMLSVGERPTAGGLIKISTLRFPCLSQSNSSE